MTTSPSLLPTNYAEVLADLKHKVRSAQTKAATAVNHELIALYLDIGRHLIEHHTWGAAVVERLARDLKAEFPQMEGFSRSNLFYMKKVFAAWSNSSEEVQQLAGQVPWWHHVVIVTKVDDPAAREFYLRQTVDNGLSRAVLTLQIESGLHARHGQALTNFGQTLPEPTSDLAQQTLKDPYVFDFLTLGRDARERDLEQGLLDHIQKFLLELGIGFAFVGRQVHLEVSGRDFYLDLLFYHLRLRCFVVVELKAIPFEPEFTGKLNFYLSAVDDLLRHDTDGPTIGLLLCKGKDRLLVEYALRDIAKPMGVAEWQTKIVESLPDSLVGSLPSIQDLEAELAQGDRADSGCES